MEQILPDALQTGSMAQTVEPLLRGDQKPLSLPATSCLGRCAASQPCRAEPTAEDVGMRAQLVVAVVAHCDWCHLLQPAAGWLVVRRVEKGGVEGHVVEGECTVLKQVEDPFRHPLPIRGREVEKHHAERVRLHLHLVAALVKAEEAGLAFGLVVKLVALSAAPFPQQVLQPVGTIVVDNLVRNDESHLGLILRLGHKPHIDENHALRRGEGIGLSVGDGVETQFRPQVGIIMEERVSNAAGEGADGVAIKDATAGQQLINLV